MKPAVFRVCFRCCKCELYASDNALTADCGSLTSTKITAGPELSGLAAWLATSPTLTELL